MAVICYQRCKQIDGQTDGQTSYGDNNTLCRPTMYVTR